MYKPTIALSKISRLTKPIRVIEGSQGAGKTIGILMLMINNCLRLPNKECTVLQYELSKMKKTIVRDFLKIMRSSGFFNEKKWNKTENLYNFGDGSYIEFLGLDSSDMGKGFRRDVIYFNEANKGKINLDTFVQMQSRSIITYVDYNPDELFWIHTDILKQTNCDFIRVTFNDNQYLPEGERQAILDYAIKGFIDPNGDVHDQNNIKNKFWANKHIVYALGQPGRRDGTIFSDYEIIDAIPANASLIGSGMDFGYSQDPTAAVTAYKLNEDVIFDEILFMKGLSISEIVASIKHLEMGVTYCDSAEPRSISELRRYGLRVLPAKKGPGSVLAGLNLLMGKRLLITARSHNIIFALKHYSWLTDREGNYLPKPNHLYSDVIDAMRYLAYMKFTHKQQDPKENRYSII